jgi:hypothetical protein
VATALIKSSALVLLADQLDQAMADAAAALVAQRLMV